MFIIGDSSPKLFNFGGEKGQLNDNGESASFLNLFGSNDNQQEQEPTAFSFNFGFGNQDNDKDDGKESGGFAFNFASAFDNGKEGTAMSLFGAGGDSSDGNALFSSNNDDNQGNAIEPAFSFNFGSNADDKTNSPAFSFNFWVESLAQFD